MACNIVDEAAGTSAASLHQQIAALAEEAGAHVEHAYRIGNTLAELRQEAEKVLGN